MMRLSHVSKQFNDHPVLNDIDFEIEDGIVLGLIGANGAGKSTLLRIMAGIYQSDLGHTYFDEQEVYNRPEFKREILLIGDDPFHFFNATLKEMKEFYKLWYPQFDEGIYQTYVKKFRLDENKSMGNFSKGMLRQGFLIIGLAIAPRYLLLDEAFDGLDPMMRLEFKKAIAQRLEEKKMSVIISSHDLKEMQDLCDSFAMLDHGCLHTSGNVVETLDHIHKYQMAFATEMEEGAFSQLDLLSLEISSRVVNLVARGDEEKIESYLQSLQPLLFEVLDVSLEEIFIYEVEMKGGIRL